MNHKRGRPKNRRSGCLMCKRHKVNGANDESLGMSGHKPGGTRGAKNKIYSNDDLKEWQQ